MVFLKNLFRFFLFFTIVALYSCPQDIQQSAGQNTPPELPFGQELQQALDQTLRQSQGIHDLGISAAVCVPGYKTWTGVSGNSQPGVPVTPAMVFDAGSITKNFEAALALKFAEQGLLNLDEPISKWLPPYPKVNGAITIRQLLNHTSGIFNVFEHPDFPWAKPDIDYSRKWRVEEVLASYVKEPYGPPGYAQHYSSTNYLLLTAILEKAAGAPVSEDVERQFFHPLKMNHSFMTMEDPLPKHLIAAHPWIDIDQDGVLEDLAGIPLTWIVTLTHPVLYTTPEDLARWFQALYYDRSVLSEKSLKEMLTIPGTTLTDPDGRRYGLGVIEINDFLKAHVLGHGGSAMGYSAAAFYLPEYGISVAWLFNTGEGPLELASKMMNDTWSSLWGVLRTHLKPLY